jgi:pantoate--beta-alanine ligase
MELWRSPDALRQACDEARRRRARVALVPTMGALHQGHTTLIAEAAKRADFVAVSIFVNPTQFGPKEDFARYPRDLAGDARKCEEAGAHGIFTPDAQDMYPQGDETRVRVGATAEGLCGPHRPGHFEGVATVVAKLFSITGPSIALFGRKDYQQLKVIERMTRDLFLPVDVVGLPTVREPDGLAMSSRNAYLSPEAREAARHIPRALAAAAAAFSAGEQRAGVIARIAWEIVAEVATSIDYVDVADPDTVRVLDAEEQVGERALLALAVRLGGARLIDNIVLGEDAAPLTSG